MMREYFNLWGRICYRVEIFTGKKNKEWVEYGTAVVGLNYIDLLKKYLEWLQ